MPDVSEHVLPAEHSPAPSRTVTKGEGCPGLFTTDKPWRSWVGRLICLPTETPVWFAKCHEPGLRCTLSYSWRLRSSWSNTLTSHAEFSLSYRLSLHSASGDVSQQIMECRLCISKVAAVNSHHGLVTWSRATAEAAPRRTTCPNAVHLLLWTWPNHILHLDFQLRSDLLAFSWNTTSPFLFSPTPEHVALNIPLWPSSTNYQPEILIRYLIFQPCKWDFLFRVAVGQLSLREKDC